jgi:hypothetical protein
MFGAVLDALKVLCSAFSALLKLSQEKRGKFAGICDRISDVLINFIDATKNKKPQFNLCAELREYVVPLRDIASGAIVSKEMDRLANELEHVCDTWDRVEKEANESGRAYELDLRQIEESAGTFKGLANRLRAT